MSARVTPRAGRAGAVRARPTPARRSWARRAPCSRPRASRPPRCARSRRGAGVDPALVHHYFGTKDDLFLAALELPVDPRGAARAGDRGPAPTARASGCCGCSSSVWDDRAPRLPLLALVRGVFEPAGQRCCATGFAADGARAGRRTALGIDRPERRMAAGRQPDGRPGHAPLRAAASSRWPRWPPTSWSRRTPRRCSATSTGHCPTRPLTEVALPEALIHHMVNNAVEYAGLRVVPRRQRVLRDLDFAVPAGSVTGLLGPSGCGKSTLMRAIVGVQRIAAGIVTVLGQPAGLAACGDRIGYVTQSASVYDDLTVRENLRFFGRVLGVRAERIRTCLDAGRPRPAVRPGGGPALRRPAVPGLAGGRAPRRARPARPRRADRRPRPRASPASSGARSTSWPRPARRCSCPAT